MNVSAAVQTVASLPVTVQDLYPRNVKSERTLRTREEFLQAARDVIPVLRRHTRKSDEIRRPADESVHALVKAGLFEILRPKMYGGPGLELSDAYDVGAVLAEGCASTAWDYIVWEVHNWLIGTLSKQAQDEIFGASELTLCCGVFNPTGAKARAVDGGFMVSGRWPFGSGSTHSSWGCVVAIIDGREINGRPEVRMMAVPRSQYEVLDTWRMRGLSGTGSHDIFIGQEIFVPEHRTVTNIQINEGTAPGGKLHDTAAYRVPARPGAHLAAAATAVGAARAAINEFRELASKRVYVSGLKQVDMAAPAIRIGTALVEVEAAQLLFQNTIREIEREASAGRQLSVEMRAKTRMVSGYVPEVCRQIVASMVAASGARAMSEDSMLSALLLDVTTMASHQSTQFDLGHENYGRVMLGLPPSNPVI